MISETRRPALDRSRTAVLEAATRLLLDDPTLSLSELASQIGIGRTTLHRMFPTREAVLTAVAHDALDHLGVVYADAFSTTHDGRDGPIDAIKRLVEMLVPAGPRLMFLLRAAELRDDPVIDQRSARLDAPLREAVQRAQQSGELQADVADWWIIASLYATVYIAWEQVERGGLAARDAAPLVLRTWLHGLGPTDR